MIRLLTFVLLSQTVLSQDFASVGRTDAILEGFYRQPSFELLTKIIRTFDADTTYQTDKWAQLSFTSFFVVAFERYSRNSAQLIDLSNSLVNTKKLVQGALRMSQKKDAILNYQDHTPMITAMLWSGYFAPGEPRYLKRLISEMSLCERTDSILVTVTGLAAKLSLCTYARQFPEVREYLEDALGNAPPLLFPHIHDALYLSPDQIKRQISDVDQHYRNQQN